MYFFCLSQLFPTYHLILVLQVEVAMVEQVPHTELDVVAVVSNHTVLMQVPVLA
jgi:hypothetical protein